MATQGDGGISFVITPEEDRQHIRLLELPAPLLALLTSTEAPVLKFKSLQGPSGGDVGSNTVLCTPKSTYNIRQVNHSNSQYLTRPVQTPEDDFGNPAIEAFSSSGFVLELSPNTGGSALPLLQAAVPLWRDDPELLGHGMSRLSKQEHFDNIPFDDAECERAWLELCCCEVRGVAQQSTNDQQLRAWQHILATLRIEGVNLSSPLALETTDTLQRGSDDADVPVEVLNAVLSAITEEGSLHHDKCVRFVGLRLLIDKHKVSTKTFEQEWKDNLPEQWREDATTDRLTGHFTLQNNGEQILHIKTARAPAASSIPSADAASNKTTTGSKRKWHEKFRPNQNP